MMVVYQGMVLLLAVLVTRVVWRSRSLPEQGTGTLVLVVLLLRLFLVK